MQLIQDLRDEHDLIERMLGSLRTFVAERLAGQAPLEDASAFLAFFQRYAGDFHHDREETVLFAALVERAELTGDRGPIAALTDQHRRMGDILRELGTLLAAALASDGDRTRLGDLTVAYSHALWRHIDAENSVLLPEAEERLRRAHVLELPSRPMNRAEAGAQEAALALLLRYRPLYDPSVHRGDGCIACPSYGTTCDGLEQEWWTDLEWEDMWERRGGGD